MPTDSIIEIQPFYQPDTAYWASVQVEPSTGVPLDSVFPAREVPPVVVRRSLFASHTLPVNHTDLQPRQQHGAAPWLFVLIVVLAALTYLYVSSRKIKIKELLSSTVDRRTLDRLVRGNNLTPMRLMSIGLLLSSLAAVTVSHMALAKTGFLGWMLSAAALSAAYFIRWGLLRVLGRVFDNEEAMSAYINSSYLYHLLLTMALIPLTLMLVYMPWGNTAVLGTMGGLVALAFAMRMIRGVKLFLTISSTTSFYLFYYLCTVELAPLLVLIWWFFAQ
ncbi:MAG: DUF4271 domain-containing protein [Bacteroidales bacterium]|nr:DUF4271 domain-containing protein [Bacteroidales bacterium]